MKQVRISTHNYKDQDIELLVTGKKISYVFEVHGNRYGNAVTIHGRKRQDIVDATFNLVTNFIETYDLVKKGK